VTKTFPATLEALYAMLDFIEQEALPIGFAPSTLSQIELAAEEALVNIVNYGYPQSPGEVEIECQRHQEEESYFKIIIRDQGIPYDPLNAQQMLEREKIDLRIERGMAGGLGIFFILKIMDQVEYRRENERNVLSLVKYVIMKRS
jgi:serine/threonine-protein kinase RsbW